MSAQLQFNCVILTLCPYKPLTISANIGWSREAITTLLVNSVITAVITLIVSIIAHTGKSDTNCRAFPIAAAKPDF